MSKHTPGPWKVSLPNELTIVVPGDRCTVTIATVCDGPEWHTRRRRGRGTGR